MNKHLKQTAILSFVLFAGLAAGCTKNYYEYPEGGGNQRSITLSSEVQFGTTPRLQDEQIVSGQSLSLFVTRTGSVEEGSQLYQNNRITANGMGGFIYRVPMFYPSDGTNIDFYAIHPYYDSAILGTPHNFTIQTNQSSQVNYLNSDLLFGTETDIPAQTNAVPLIFNHKLSKLDFIVTTSDQSINLDLLTTISVLQTLSSTTVNTQTGVLTTATGVRENIITYSDPQATGTPTNRVTGYTAIVVPQIMPGGQQLFEVIIDGIPRFYTHPIDYTFESGKKYNITLDISSTGITIQSQIANWEGGGSISGPAGPQ